MVIITTVRIFITLPPLSLLRGFVVFCSVFLFRLSPFLACLLFLSLSRSFGPILDSSLLFSLSLSLSLSIYAIHIAIQLSSYFLVTVTGPFQAKVVAAVCICRCA